MLIVAIGIIARSKVKFALSAEELPQIEVTGFASGAIFADVAGTILLNSGIDCISNTFENPGSLPAIKRFAKQGHFSNIAPKGILTDDLRGYFHPFLSTSLVDQTYGDHCANTINVFDIIYAAGHPSKKISIEEFFSAILGKEPEFRHGPAIEEDNEPPPLVELPSPSLLEDEIRIVVIGDDEDEELFDVPL